MQEPSADTDSHDSSPVHNVDSHTLGAFRRLDRNSETHHDSDPEAGLAEKVLTMDDPGLTAPKDTKAKDCDPSLRGWRMVVQNFTPSWFIITMSTGVLSLMLHLLPYNGHWLQVIANIYFVLNLVLFVLFTAISALRYTLYPHLWGSVVKHPHQSLFLATFPVGLATLVNMTVLAVAPRWGHGVAIVAWVFWWIVVVLALATCIHMTYVIMTHRRGELAEMSALYLIPVVAVVIAAASGSLVANAIPDPQHQLWVLIISYILWGLASPLSWIILTIYFLRLALYEPLKREVIVSLLLPIGPLSLSGFSIITLSKVALRLFPIVHALPRVKHIAPGEALYTISLFIGLILWGFAVVWFIIAVMMIAMAGGFPFNMGWWGFIFPIGIFTLLTIVIGEELESHVFRIISCILTVICVLMWFVIACMTIERAITGKMFYAPCLGTDLYGKKPHNYKRPWHHLLDHRVEEKKVEKKGVGEKVKA